MSQKLRITLCGGGNLTHAQAAYLARKGHLVNIYTRHPGSWASSLHAKYYDGDERMVPLGTISHLPEVIQESDIVIISLPRFAIREVSEQILPFLNDETLLIYAPGTPDLLELEHDLRWRRKSVCALYKVPFISRAEHYGHSVSVLGSRDVNRIWYSHPSLRKKQQLIEDLYDTPLVELSSAYPFLLTNSNPLLHPSRLLVMFKDYAPGVYYDHNFLFYEEWTQESSELYIAADSELLRVCERCPGMMIGRDIIPVTEYYDSPTAELLTQKIRSITAFKGIRSPMKQLEHGWIPDFSSRYFTEDIAWGTGPICDYAKTLHVETPILEQFIGWTHSMLQREPK